MKISTELTRARRSAAALALDPSRHQRPTLTHSNLQNLTNTTKSLHDSQKGTPRFDVVC
jgi:hypothetical protein